MSLMVIGTLAFDSIETPYDKRERALGGSATYFAYAASPFNGVNLIGVVGTDFPDEHFEGFKARGVDCRGVEVVEGKSFFWAGRYEADWNTRVTLDTQLNVFGDFDPKVPFNSCNWIYGYSLRHIISSLFSKQDFELYCFRMTKVLRKTV